MYVLDYLIKSVQSKPEGIFCWSFPLMHSPSFILFLQHCTRLFCPYQMSILKTNKYALSLKSFSPGSKRKMCSYTICLHILQIVDSIALHLLKLSFPLSSKKMCLKLLSHLSTLWDLTDVASAPKWLENDLYEAKFKQSESSETEIRDLSVAW